MSKNIKRKKSAEADFLQDVLINNARIVSLAELNKLSEDNWDPVTSLYKYYGIKQEELQPEFKELSMGQLPEFAEKFIVGASFWEDKTVSAAKAF